MSRAVPLAIAGAVLLGIAFAMFPVSGIAEEWAAQRASTTTEVYQLVSVAAVVLAGAALALMGAWRALPLPPFGFLLCMIALAAGAWYGVGVILGG